MINMTVKLEEKNFEYFSRKLIEKKFFFRYFAKFFVKIHRKIFAEKILIFFSLKLFWNNFRETSKFS